jgi:YD repeat-containing protein
MKKILFALMAVVALVTVSCSKTEEETTETSLKGRWEAPRFPDTPEDIAFVALFGEANLDLYVVSWGQHLRGTYTWANNVVKYNITEAYKALTDVEYDEEGNMTSWSWNMGNLDATTLDLTSGYEWYPMTAEELNRAKEDFGEFEFNVSGNTATSSLVGIDNVTFNKVN